MNLADLPKVFYDIFSKMARTCCLQYTIPVCEIRKTTDIHRNSNLGEQIKHFRLLAGLTQEELGQAIGTTKNSLRHLENKKLLLLDMKLLGSVCAYLKIEDKIKYNDDYIEFVMKNPTAQINDYREREGISVYELSLRLNCDYSSAKNWASGKRLISRKKYEVLKKLMSAS